MPYAVRLRDKLLVQIPLPATAECFRLHRLVATFRTWHCPRCDWYARIAFVPVQCWRCGNPREGTTPQSMPERYRHRTD
jgi:hypothetical protein